MMIFIVNKHIVIKQNRSTSESDSVEWLKSSVSVARRVLRKENQYHAHESDVNKNSEGTLKQHYRSISHINGAFITSKSKALSRKTFRSMGLDKR